MDRSVGEIMSLLKELKLDENTIVFFTSDNGGQAVDGADRDFFHANGQLRGAKMDLYEGGIRVPMIVRWPGHIAPGSTTDLIAAHWDVFPTLAELAGAKSSDDLDGISVLPTLLGSSSGEQEQHKYLYWEYMAGRKLSQAVRHGRWKALRDAPGAALQLYDLAADLGETRNIADQEQDVVAEIEEFLTESHTEWRKPDPSIPKRGKADYVR
jgi:arylsulfatase A-like enzyme